MTDLAALIAMRLTHDLAGPLGAVAMGVDLLDHSDPEVRALIADGTGAAVTSLKLHRFILVPMQDMAPAQGLLAAWVATRPGVTLDWRAAPDHADIILGLAMTAVEAAGKGGTLVVDGATVTFTPARSLDVAVATALAGEAVTIARAALAGILHARATERGGTIVVDTDGPTLSLAYHGSALPR